MSPLSWPLIASAMQVAYPGGVIPVSDPDAYSPEVQDKAKELEMHRNSLRTSVMGAPQPKPVDV